MRVGSAAMSSSSSTRPLAQKATGAAKRALHRLAGTKRGRQAEDSLGDGGSAAGLDEWLVPLFGDELNRIDAVVKGAGVEGYGEFRGLDDDLWSLLLTEIWGRQFLDQRGAPPRHELPPVRRLTKTEGRAAS